MATVCLYPWQNMQQLWCDTCSPAVALDQLTVPLIRRHQRAHTQHIPEEPTHEFPVVDLCGKKTPNNTSTEDKNGEDNPGQVVDILEKCNPVSQD